MKTRSLCFFLFLTTLILLRFLLFPPYLPSSTSSISFSSNTKPIQACPSQITLPKTTFPEPPPEELSRPAAVLPPRPLIDLPLFSFLLLPPPCPPSPDGQLVLVHSSVPHTKQRALIRSTWARPVPELHTRVVFLLGIGEEGSQRELEQEFELGADLVQGDFVDSYHNLTYKNVMGLLWVTEYCSGARVIVKTDDDMWLDLHAIATTSLALPREGELLACTVLDDLPVQRAGKWAVSEEEMEKSRYPAACSGWLYFLSNVTAATLLRAATGAKYFWIDDVWVTGILRESIGLELTNIPLTITTSSSHLQMSKAIQSPMSWHWDFLAGPAPFQEAANIQLTEMARRCFLEKCLSNIYRPEVEATGKEVEGETVLLRLAELEPVVEKMMKIYG